MRETNVAKGTAFPKDIADKLHRLVALQESKGLFSDEYAEVHLDIVDWAAGLDISRYQAISGQLAKILKYRKIGKLDREVEERRQELDDKGGNPLGLVTPVPWEKPVNGAELADRVRDHLKERLVYEDVGAHEVMTLASFHTHVFECFPTNPRVLFTAQKEDMGKSVAQKLYASLCPRSHIFVTATDSVLKRIGKWKPTAHMDEIDGSLKGREMLRVIIDGGWSKATSNAIMSEAVGENTYEARAFDVYFPMSLAGIGTPHKTIVSRSFVLRMGNRRKETAPRDPKTGELIDPSSANETRDVFCRKIARWAQDNQEKLSTAKPRVPEELFNRSADNWKVLFTIADTLGGHWPETIRDIAVRWTHADVPDETHGVQLLRDIRAIFAEVGAKAIRGGLLVEELIRREQSPIWQDWKGKYITAAEVQSLLKSFRIQQDRHKGVTELKRDDRNRVINVRKATVWGYHVDSFRDAWETYAAETVEGDAPGVRIPQPRTSDRLGGILEELERLEPLWVAARPNTNGYGHD